jgi:hypothetical protein
MIVWEWMRSVVAPERAKARLHHKGLMLPGTILAP